MNLIGRMIFFMMLIMKRSRLGIGLMLACLIAAGCGGRSSVGQRRLPVGDRDLLVLKVPLAWKQIDRSAADGTVQSYMFTAGEGKAFRVTVTPLAAQQLKFGFSRPENIRALVENEGTDLLPNALESKIRLEELRVGDVVGYHFTLTDRAPKPGEFKYLIEGARGFPQMLVMFSILAQDRQSEVCREALSMIAASRVEEIPLRDRKTPSR